MARASLFSCYFANFLKAPSASSLRKTLGCFSARKSSTTFIPSMEAAVLIHRQPKGLLGVAQRRIVFGHAHEFGHNRSVSSGVEL